MLTIRMSRTITSQVQEGDLPIQGPALRPGFGPEDIYQMHGCCTGPFEAPGHPCTELSGWLAHSGSLQGASESSQGYCSRPHPFSWPQDERQEECAPPISTNRISRSSFGFRSDAGPFGSCPDTSFYSMFGPLQARPSCLCRYLPQAVGPYGSSLPCVAPRAASHEAIPFVDEGAEVTPHCTSYSPYQSVAQLLLTPVNVARPRLSPEWGENVFEGRPASGEWKEEFLFWHINCLELRAVFLALKYFLPILGGHHIIVRTDNMDAPWTGLRAIFSFGPKTSSSLWGRFTFREYWTWRPIFCQDRSSSPGNGCWTVRRYPRSGICLAKRRWTSLLLTRVIPVPALVLPKFPDDSGHRCVRPLMAECQSVCVSANKADSGSTMQSEGERCPSPSHNPILALPDLVLGANSPLVSASLGDSDQAGLTYLKKWVLRRDLKVLIVLACLISIGKEFHSFGANEEKALSPIDLKRVKGTVRRPVSDERRSRVGV